MRIARVYDDVDDDAPRVLVDRLWPRGIRKDDPRVVHWLKDVAPSTELRKWYGHDPARFEEFATRYQQELDDGVAAAAFAELATLADQGPLTLVTATRDLAHSQAAVLAGLLAEATDDGERERDSS